MREGQMQKIRGNLQGTYDTYKEIVGGSRECFGVIPLITHCIKKMYRLNMERVCAKVQAQAAIQAPVEAQEIVAIQEMVEAREIAETQEIVAIQETVETREIMAIQEMAEIQDIVETQEKADIQEKVGILEKVEVQEKDQAEALLEETLDMQVEEVTMMGMMEMEVAVVAEVAVVVEVAVDLIIR